MVNIYLEAIANPEAAKRNVTCKGTEPSVIGEIIRARIRAVIYADSTSPVINFIKSYYFRFLKKIHTSLSPSFYMYPREYRTLIDKLLAKSYILHFSSGFPFLNSVKK